MTTQPDSMTKPLTPVAKAALSLSIPQREMIVASGPDDIDGSEGVGVELHGAEYRTAKSLEALGLGRYTHGSFYSDMYWNRPKGLLVRDYLLMRGLA